jgi:hypothetical protein
MPAFVQYYPRQKMLEPEMPEGADKEDFAAKLACIRDINKRTDAELKAGFITVEVRITKPLENGRQSHNTSRSLVKLPVTEELAAFINTPVISEKLYWNEYLPARECS